MIGHRLKAWRKRARLTQEQAAELVDACQSAWNKWERGEGTPCQATRLMIDRLTGGDIPQSDWLTSQERAAIDSVRAYPMPMQAVA